MNIEERHQIILNSLRKYGKVSIREMNDVLHVSDMTIRRDLNDLENQGLLRRVYGGALSEPSLSYEPPFDIRYENNKENKEIISREVASIINEGETIIIDTGTTLYHVAKSLKGMRNITVFTMSLRIAELLSEEKGISLIVSGGKVRHGEKSLVGEQAIESLQDFIFDKFIMGIAGIHPEYGLTEYNVEDALVKKAALSSSKSCIVVADSSKIGRIAFKKICPLEDIDILITDYHSKGKLDFLDNYEIEVKFVE